MKYPFEVSFTELEANPDVYIDAVFSCLESEFLVMPRGDGFVEYPVSEFNPQVIIEAKITEDDGTARDKVTRIRHLVSMSLTGSPKGSPKFEVVACIGGRGFGVRREDMKKLLLETRGKVFTLKTLNYLVEFTRLREFKSK
jgi:hypothetical protein